MNCIIVDDDRTAILAVKRCVEETDFLTILNTFTNPLDAIQYLNKERVDLIFLDVEMPELNGLEFINKLKYKPEIIVISSKKEYAFESYGLNVTDYLQKPVEYHRFLVACEKAFQNKGNLIFSKEETDHLFVKSDSILVRLNLKEILFVEAMGDYVRIYTNKQRHMVLSTMKAFEEKLSQNKFFRIHKSYIVNLDRVEAIAGNSIPFSNKLIPISKSIKPLLLERINLM
jgi:DNA-binding LytR/AlgR family response regulator